MRSWRRRRLALSGDVVVTLLGFCVAGDTSAGGQTPLTATPVDGAATAALFLATDGNKPAAPDTAGVALSQAQPEAMPPNFSILGYGANIAVRTDGLHALPYWGLGMAAEEQSYCFLWHSNDVISSQLPWKFVLEPSVAFFNDRVAVADLVDELGPVLIAEAAVSPF